jgi:hypothetical protein
VGAIGGGRRGQTEGARGGADGARQRGPDGGGEGAGWGQTEGPHRGADRRGVRWGGGETGKIYTLSSINNIWNLTNTIELKHLKTVAHIDNKF